MTKRQAEVGIIMGSQSDWPTMKQAAAVLDELGVTYEAKIVSAHRTPDRLVAYPRAAKERGLQVIIARAGGAAHLPGLDSLYSIVQMPAGIPVGTLAIGDAGATNAGLLAAQILALSNAELAARLDAYREKQTASVKDEPKNE